MKIIWMHDLSARADAAMGPVRCLARHTDGVVLLAHAAGAPLTASRGAEDATVQYREAEAEARLQPLVEQLSAAGIPTELVLEPGQPLELATRLVREQGAGLVALGATGVGGMDRVLLGSTAGKLVRHLECSVLVVREPFQHLHRLLCAVDTRKPIAAPVIEATALALRAGAALDYATVVPPAIDLGDETPAEELLAAVLSGILEAPLPPRARAISVVAESAVQGINHVAGGYDLVVMGTAGRTGLSRLILGSVAQSVVRSCPVSVLVAR